MQTKVNEIDLVARKAIIIVHVTSYIHKKEDRNMTQAHGDERAKQHQMAHATAFEYIPQYINESIINHSNVERLGMRKEKYLLFMQQHHQEYYNPNYKT